MKIEDRPDTRRLDATTVDGAGRRETAYRAWHAEFGQPLRAKYRSTNVMVPGFAGGKASGNAGNSHKKKGGKKGTQTHVSVLVIGPTGRRSWVREELS